MVLILLLSPESWILNQVEAATQGRIVLGGAVVTNIDGEPIIFQPYTGHVQNLGQEIHECDILIYASGTGVAAKDDPSTLTVEEIDLDTVLAHELGHCLGMAHSSENENETNTLLRHAMMYFTTLPGALASKRNLNEDDITGLQTLYGRNVTSDIQRLVNDWCENWGIAPNTLECTFAACYFSKLCW